MTFNGTVLYSEKGRKGQTESCYAYLKEKKFHLQKSKYGLYAYFFASLHQEDIGKLGKK